MKSIAIIPARGGSKRIPRKNIRPFLGVPILARVVGTALKSGCFDEVMVSTDDAEIAEIAVKAGASVPFMRSAETSTDHAVTLDVLREVISQYHSLGIRFATLCCIYPTAVLSRAESLRKGKEKLLTEPVPRCVLPVVPYGHPVQRALYEEGGRIHMLQPEHCRTRSQDLVKCYHDAGQWYWMWSDVLEDPSFQILGPDSAPVFCTEMEVQDVDNEIDWELAELKYQLTHR